jgi:formylglycine-generating enzyme required for sulfatase activity
MILPHPTAGASALRLLVLGLCVANALGAPPSAPSPHIVPDLNLTLVWIAPGTFRMGSAPDEGHRHPSEGPARGVTLTQGFWLGKTEGTQAQYAALSGTHPSRFTAVGPDAPVERVSWLGATEFCRQLTARERTAGRLPAGYVYDLPTEAQWEYACRAGTTGDYAGLPDAMAWHKDNNGETTHPVARQEPNAWGLHDMAGNVLEWCRDWFGDYPRGAQTDPTGPVSGHFRIARGGSWRVAATSGRSAARGGGSPGREDYTLGFRLAFVPAP